MKHNNFPVWKIVLVWLSIGYICWIILSLGLIGLAVRSHRLTFLKNSTQSLSFALKPISVLTFERWSELETVDNGAKLIISGIKIWPDLKDYFGQIWPESVTYAKRQETIKKLKPELINWLTDVNHWWLNLKQSSWWKFIPLRYKQIPIDQVSLDLITSLDYFSIGSKTFLIVFQNSEELRATGGFMGSYAKLDFQDGLLTEINIQDIYQPAGQFKGFVPAPPGVAEYLSGGKGLQLSDANWWPDFPISAQTVLNYFAFGKQQEITGLVAINLEVAEDLLRVLGPVYLKDYDVTVSAENLATVARADRKDFFPGSQQKAHFLTLLFDQLKFKVADFRSIDAIKLAQLLFRRLQNKDIQIFSPVEKLQTLVEKYGLSGKISFQPQVFGELKQTITSPSSLQPLYLQLVESNVGINKANSGIVRTVIMQVLASQLQIQVDYVNNHPKLATSAAELKTENGSNNHAELTNGLGYVNYQRLIISPFMKVVGIFFDELPINLWQENQVNWSNINLKQIGFIITVPEASKRQLTLILEPDTSAPVTNLLNLPGITIQKQAGLPPTPYEIVWGNQRQNLILESDTLIKF